MQKNLIANEEKKIRMPVGSILLVNEDVRELVSYSKIIQDMNVTRNLLRFTSSKDAFENLSLIKFNAGTGQHRYPELIITDAALNYYADRKFLDDLVHLYPSKTHRPFILSLWKNEPPFLHLAVDMFLKKPMRKEELIDFLKKHS
jgi:hypothetical protein